MKGSKAKAPSISDNSPYSPHLLSLLALGQHKAVGCFIPELSSTILILLTLKLEVCLPLRIHRKGQEVLSQPGL